MPSVHHYIQHSFLNVQRVALTINKERIDWVESYVKYSHVFPENL